MVSKAVIYYQKDFPFGRPITIIDKRQDMFSFAPE